MKIEPCDSDLKKLFKYNRMLPTAEIYARIEEIEKPWIAGVLANLEATTRPVASRTEWIDLLNARVAEEDAGNEATRFLAEEATWDQIRVYVKEFAPDGLTEAQNFFPAVPRVPIRAQMAIMRVLIDEFGCGNINQAHSNLYVKLLEEMDLPTDLESVIAETSDAMFEMLNSFYWLASRAPTPEYFLGALAYLEAAIPGAFAPLARGCERLGIRNSAYYTEHIHIDDFHKKEMQTAIREYEIVHGLNATNLWIGAQLLSNMIGAVVDVVVEKARRLDVLVEH
jgi:Iron-containing redox enzyme